MKTKIINFFKNISKNENYSKEFENITNTKDLLVLFKKYNPECENITEEEFYRNLDEIINFVEVKNTEALENVPGGSFNRKFYPAVLSSALIATTFLGSQAYAETPMGANNETSKQDKNDENTTEADLTTKILNHVRKYGIQSACAIFGIVVVFKILKSAFSSNDEFDINTISTNKIENPEDVKKTDLKKSIPSPEPSELIVPPVQSVVPPQEHSSPVEKPEWVRDYDLGEIKNEYIDRLYSRLPETLNKIKNKNEFSDDLITQWTGEFKKIYNSGVLNRIRVVKGNIVAPKTEWHLDCIVNAANEMMRGGGGVDGVVHNKAGSELLNFEKNNNLNCRNFVAVPTPSFNLQSKGIKNIIHVAAPRRLKNKDNKNEIVNMWKCYANAIYCAKELGRTNVAIPALGVGIYKNYLAISTMIAYEATAFMLNQEGYVNMNVTFVCYNNPGYADAKAQCKIYSTISKHIKRDALDPNLKACIF